MKFILGIILFTFSTNLYNAQESIEIERVPYIGFVGEHIEQSTPFENILIAMKNDTVELFKKAFSKKIFNEFDAEIKWQDVLRQAKSTFKERFGEFDITDFTYGYDKKSSNLIVFFKAKEYDSIKVLNENGSWKLNQK